MVSILLRSTKNVTRSLLIEYLNSLLRGALYSSFKTSTVVWVRSAAFCAHVFVRNFVVCNFMTWLHYTCHAWMASVIFAQLGELALENLLSIEEAAQRLGGISKWTLHAWLSKGRLQRTKVGSRTMIAESELKKVIETGGKSHAPCRTDDTV